MKRLYYENQYIKEFEAKIMKKTIEEDKVKIILDKTAFFPGGGGQKNDLGFINGTPVVNLYEEGDEVVHLLEEDIEADIGEEVTGKIDWERRKDGMEQHLGQHILSGAFYHLLGRNTVSIHLGKDLSTVDIIGEVSEKDIEKVNIYANSIIESNRKVLGYFPKNEELKDMELRRDLPTTDKEIRVLQIEGLDLTPCCGVHLSSTLEVRLIKIKRFEKYKKNTRIYFLAGGRAITDTLGREKALKEIELNLSSSGNETINSINNLKNEINNLKKERKELEDTIISSELKEILSKGKNYFGVEFLHKRFKDKDNNFIRNLSNKAIKEKNRIIVLTNETKSFNNIILASSKNIEEINLVEIYNNNSYILEGKGGGSKNRVEIMAGNSKIDEFIWRIEEVIKNKKTI